MVNWNKTRIGSIIIGKPSYGINAAACKYKSGLPNYIRITDITNNGKYSKDDLAYVDNEQAINYYLKDNDIVFARTGASVGKSYLYNSSDGELVFAGFLIKISVDPEKADSRFVFAAVNTEQFRNWVLASSMRSGQPGINGGQYASYSFLLPSLPEQRAIAAALYDIDNYMAALERLIAKKQNIKKGTMQELLTGKRRLPRFDSNWVETTLGDICEIKDGTHGTYARVDNGYLLLSAKNIFNNELRIGDESYIAQSDYESIVSCGFPQENDILLSCVGTIGRCCIYSGKPLAAFQRSVAFIRSNSVSPSFLLYLLQGSRIQRQLIQSANASAQGGVYLGALAKIELAYPSDNTEQLAIADILSDMDEEIDVLTAKLNKVRNIKQGMMRELLTGRIRLIQEDTDDAED